MITRSHQLYDEYWIQPEMCKNGPRSLIRSCGSRRDQRKFVTVTNLSGPASLKLAGLFSLALRMTGRVLLSLTASNLSRVRLRS
jgi:hypothetical protein